MTDELALAARVPYELFVTILQYAFLAFVVCSVIVLFGVALKYILWVLDKVYLFWDTFVDVNQKRSKMHRRVEMLWNAYQYAEKKKEREERGGGFMRRRKLATPNRRSWKSG